jgi:hypothetical protein
MMKQMSHDFKNGIKGPCFLKQIPKPPIQWVPGVISLGVKQQER